MLSIAFTGHRPNNKNMGGYDWTSPKNQVIMKELKGNILKILLNEWDDISEPVTFYFGGALGVDQMAFNICKEIESEYDGEYNFILAMPFEKQDNNWFNQKDRDELQYEIDEANKVILVDTLDKYKINGYAEGEYYPAKMQKRNEYMVDNADIVIAVWDGSKGGTGNCVKYAERLSRRIIQINPKNIE